MTIEILSGLLDDEATGGEAGYYLTTTVLACQYILCADLWGTV